MLMQEVSRAHSTQRRKTAKGKERIQPIDKLNPQYVVGFIDGEGSFNVSIYKDETMANKVFVRPEFSIELRADDRNILERVRITIGCGKIYACNYERYGWYPHAKYKVSRLDEISRILIPFLEKYRLQAKKSESFEYFKKIVKLRMDGKHLTASGVKSILNLREKMRLLGKKHHKKWLETARVRENRSPGGVGQLTH